MRRSPRKYSGEPDKNTPDGVCAGRPCLLTLSRGEVGSEEEHDGASSTFSDMQGRANLDHGPERPRRRMTAQVTVTILGEDSVFARTLELLLQGFGYRTRSATEIPPSNPSGGFLDGAQVLLLVPGSNPGLRGAALSVAECIPHVPVLELVADLHPGQDWQKHRVPWPCRTEDLKQRIEDAISEGHTKR